MTTTEARKRRHERDMADAHATARARDARPLMTHFTVTANGWVIDNQTGEFSRLNQESDMPETTDVTSPAQLRHNGIVALLTEIRDRLPEREGVKDEPETCRTCGQALIVTGTIDCLTCFLAHQRDSKAAPAPADDLPGEPVEPGDLRAGDRVAFTYGGERLTCNLVSSPSGSSLRSDTPDSGGYTPGIVFRGRWDSDISDVRLIERAPREGEDPDEEWARERWAESANIASWSALHPETQRVLVDFARSARKHIEAERAALVEEGIRQKARAIKAEAERDALRERLDALRADVERFSAGDPLITPLDILARDDERAAKGEQR